MEAQFNLPAPTRPKPYENAQARKKREAEENNKIKRAILDRYPYLGAAEQRRTKKYRTSYPFLGTPKGPPANDNEGNRDDNDDDHDYDDNDNNTRRNVNPLLRTPQQQQQTAQYVSPYAPTTTQKQQPRPFISQSAFGSLRHGPMENDPRQLHSMSAHKPADALVVDPELLNTPEVLLPSSGGRRSRQGSEPASNFGVMEKRQEQARAHAQQMVGQVQLMGAAQQLQNAQQADFRAILSRPLNPNSSTQQPRQAQITGRRTKIKPPHLKSSSIPPLTITGSFVGSLNQMTNMTSGESELRFLPTDYSPNPHPNPQPRHSISNLPGPDLESVTITEETLKASALHRRIFQIFGDKKAYEQWEWTWNSEQEKKRRESDALENASEVEGIAPSARTAVIEENAECGYDQTGLERPIDEIPIAGDVQAQSFVGIPRDESMQGNQNDTMLMDAFSSTHSPPLRQPKYPGENTLEEDEAIAKSGWLGDTGPVESFFEDAFYFDESSNLYETSTLPSTQQESAYGSSNNPSLQSGSLFALENAAREIKSKNAIMETFSQPFVQSALNQDQKNENDSSGSTGNAQAQNTLGFRVSPFVQSSPFFQSTFDDQAQGEENESFSSTGNAQTQIIQTDPFPSDTLHAEFLKYWNESRGSANDARTQNIQKEPFSSEVLNAFSTDAHQQIVSDDTTESEWPSFQEEEFDMLGYLDIDGNGDLSQVFPGNTRENPIYYGEVPPIEPSPWTSGSFSPSAAALLRQQEAHGSGENKNSNDGSTERLARNPNTATEFSVGDDHDDDGGNLRSTFAPAFKGPPNQILGSNDRSNISVPSQSSGNIRQGVDSGSMPLGQSVGIMPYFGTTNVNVNLAADPRLQGRTLSGARKHSQPDVVDITGIASGRPVKSAKTTVNLAAPLAGAKPAPVREPVQHPERLRTQALFLKPPQRRGFVCINNPARHVCNENPNSFSATTSYLGVRTEEEVKHGGRVRECSKKAAHGGQDHFVCEACRNKATQRIQTVSPKLLERAMLPCCKSCSQTGYWEDPNYHGADGCVCSETVGRWLCFECRYAELEAVASKKAAERELRGGIVGVDMDGMDQVAVMGVVSCRCGTVLEGGAKMKVEQCAGCNGKRHWGFYLCTS